eukprot:gene14080-9797_t
MSPYRDGSGCSHSDVSTPYSRTPMCLRRTAALRCVYAVQPHSDVSTPYSRTNGAMRRAERGESYADAWWERRHR